MMISCLKIKAQSNIDSTSIYITQKKYHKALKYVSNTGNYYVLNNIGIKLYQSKEYNNSLLFFLETLKIGKEKLNKKELKNLLNDLGHNYQNINDYNNAIKYFELVYTLNVEIYGELEYSNISALYNLIAVNDLLKDFYKTAELYLKILEIQEKSLGNVNPDYVNTIYNLAWVYLDQSRFDLAEDYFMRALEIDGKIKNIDNIDYAESLNHLYVFYGFYKLDYEKAQYYLNQIIRIKKGFLAKIMRII
jgi:tetratricopeptide (TPR) repeat protein